MEISKIIALPKVGELENVITKVLVTKENYSEWVYLEAPDEKSFKAIDKLKSADVLQMVLPKVDVAKIDAFLAKKQEVQEVEIKL
jgi:hypothetical protein